MYFDSCNLRNVLLKNQPSIQNRLRVFHLVKLKLKYALDRLVLKNLVTSNEFSPKMIKVISGLTNDASGVEASVLSCNNVKIYIKGVALDRSTMKTIKAQYSYKATGDSLVVDFSSYPFYEQNYRSALDFLDKIKIK